MPEGMFTRPEDRYRHDPTFHALVDLLRSFLEKDAGRNYTPTELREAAMLAASMHEYTHIRPLVIGREQWMRTDEQLRREEG